MDTDTDISTTRAIATLTLAFSTDPGVRWLFGDAERYLRGFGELVQLAAGGAFAAGTVDVLEAGAATAVWVPPGGPGAGEAAWGELFVRHVAPERVEEVLTWGAALGEHHPTTPHWYLAFLGTDPCWQGRGLGTALLRAGLERCDRDGLPAYLESASPRNRVLYERHGFEVRAEVQAAGAPPVWAMLRPPLS